MAQSDVPLTTINTAHFGLVTIASNATSVILA
jgi:hypothetical protein